MKLDLHYLMATQHYVLDIESFQMKDEAYYPLEWTFYGAENPTMLLTWDAERDRIRIRFEQYAVFLGTQEEHGMKEDGLWNEHPLVKLSESRLMSFASEQMAISRMDRNRGSLSHYVIRTIEQEFHVLAYEDPTVENLGKVGDTGVIVTEVSDVPEE